MTRIVHLGLGNFFRAHQAWYTAYSPDAAAWGITAFTGRSVELAERLTAQKGRYTLVTRGPERDELAQLGVIRAAHPGLDLEAWRAAWADPELAVVTMTVTEAAYAGYVPQRLLDGLAARRAAGGGPVAIVPCDNLPANGEVTRRAVLEQAPAGLAGWIGDNASFVTTVVDRITPATTPADVLEVTAMTGYRDAVPVITEPSAEWVLTGDFPAGRPGWEASGARFVADATPYAQRKLWLLNGGHSLLAYAGGARGHETVADAVADPQVRRLLEQWWDEAGSCVALPADEVAAYRASLLDRWSNTRIRHRLAQIATDGSQKIPVRVLPVLRRVREQGRVPAGGLAILRAWHRHLRGEGVPVRDEGAAELTGAATGRELLRRLDPALAADEELTAAL